MLVIFKMSLNQNLLFKIAVQLDNSTEELKVHGYDQPEVLCKEFAKKHNLNEKELFKLIEGVNACIDDLANKLDQEGQVPSPKLPTEDLLTPKKSETSKPRVSDTLKHKDCSKHLSSAVKLLESTSSKCQRYKLLSLMASQAKETYSFQPHISEK